MSIEERRYKKHEIMEQMSDIYCKGHKHPLDDNGKCADCDLVLRYSLSRTKRCPYIEETLFCSNCPTPCYRPDMKEKVREMMKYSGPRLFFKRPITVIRHVFFDYFTRIKKREAIVWI